MSQQTIPTSPAPEILVEEIHGELQVKGWENHEVAIRADSEQVDFKEQEDIVSISCRGSCSLRVPHGATLKTSRVHGEARFKLLEDLLTIEEIDGNLGLRNVAETQVGTVNGNLHARNVAGDLEVEVVNGNAILRDVQGECRLEQVKGNLDVRDVEEALTVEATGNARVRLKVLSPGEYRIHAGGDIRCRIPENASAQLKLSSGANTIYVRLPGEAKYYREASCELSLGGGDSHMEIAADGTLFLYSQPVDWSEADDLEGSLDDDFKQRFSDQVEAQIEAQMELINRQINDQLSNLHDRLGDVGLSNERTEEILRRARESSERVTARAQEKMRREQEKLERKLEAARRKEELKARAAERRSHSRSRGSWNFEWTPSSASPPKEEGVTDEERLMILRMLEQKKISLQEAEDLLAALEDRE